MAGVSEMPEYHPAILKMKFIFNGNNGRRTPAESLPRGIQSSFPS